MTNRQRLLKNVLGYNQRWLFEEYAKPVTAEGTARIAELEYVLSKLIRRIKKKKEQESAQISFDFNRMTWQRRLRNWLRV